MFKIVNVVILIVSSILLSGCSLKDERVTPPAYPAENVLYEGRIAEEFRLPDGTVCVWVFRGSGSVSCDWGNRQ